MTGDQPSKEGVKETKVEPVEEEKPDALNLDTMASALKITKLQAANDELKKSQEENAKLIEKLIENLKKSQEENAKLIEKLIDKLIEKLTENLKKSQEENVRLTKELKESQSHAGSNDDKIANLEQENLHLQDINADLKTRVQTLEHQLANERQNVVDRIVRKAMADDLGFNSFLIFAKENMEELKELAKRLNKTLPKIKSEQWEALYDSKNKYRIVLVEKIPEYAQEED